MIYPGRRLNNVPNSASLTGVKRICFYHAGCPDGLGAALAVKRAWSDLDSEEVRFAPHGHDDFIRPDAVRGALLVYVDIAPPNAVLREIGHSANKIIVLDHHASSMRRFESDSNLAAEMEDLGHEFHFDLSHSGAMLAWKYFHPDTPAPDLLRYIEDQDLWNWELLHSREINAAIGSYPQQIEAWEQLLEMDLAQLIREGEPLVRANEAEVERALKSAHAVYLGEERIEAVNCTTQTRSAVGHELAARAQFGQSWGLVYRLAGKKVMLSIYSIGDLDVSVVAARFGGGGHPNASGFSIPLDVWIKEHL